ncbi:unnamed protein product, partial [Timema podura]|nr:unnamed protein product [Timema podura]
PDGIKFRSKLELVNYLGDSWDLTEFNFRLGKTLHRAHKGKRKTLKSSIEKHSLNKSETSAIERMDDATEPSLMLYPIKFLTNGNFNWTEDMEVLELDGLPDDNTNISSTFPHLLLKNKQPNRAKASGQLESHQNGFSNKISESYLTATGNSIDKRDNIKEESKCCRTGMEPLSSSAEMEESWPNVKKEKQAGEKLASVVDLTEEEPSSPSSAPSLKYTFGSERSLLKVKRDNVSMSESDQVKLEKCNLTHSPIVATKKKKTRNRLQKCAKSPQNKVTNFEFISCNESRSCVKPKLRQTKVVDSLLPLMCNVCKLVFPSSKARHKHEQTHNHSVRLFQCHICKSSFSSATHLKRHNTIHTNVRPHECPFCNYRFRVKYHLTDHIRIHTGERRFHCSTCSMRFTQRSTYYAHLRCKSHLHRLKEKINSTERTVIVSNSLDETNQILDVESV